ncbi:glutamate racemase [Isoptericola halotolerans]|uniref:glutamate racemase n=1 Tax=Isoptericola halotolerans TaxID=300560 RepID=UPI00388F23CF
MAGKSAPIGVIDSGVGGLTTVKQLSDLLPGEDIVYCGDNGNAPYGNRTGGEIVDLTKNMLAFLVDHDVKTVAVACNTISSTFDVPAYAGYEAAYGFPVLSIIRAAAADVARMRYTSAGVIATAFTIASGCYDEIIHRLDPGIEVYGEPSRRLAELIERGDLSSPEIDQEVGAHVAALVQAHAVRDIILGCTHYPIVENVFRRHAPHVAFINPAKDQARDVRLHLSERGLLQHGAHDVVGGLSIYSSGTEQIYRTVLAELGTGRPYTFHQVDFASA